MNICFFLLFCYNDLNIYGLNGFNLNLLVNIITLIHVWMVIGFIVDCMHGIV